MFSLNVPDYCSYTVLGLYTDKDKIYFISVKKPDSKTHRSLKIICDL